MDKEVKEVKEVKYNIDPKKIREQLRQATIDSLNCTCPDETKEDKEAE